MEQRQAWRKDYPWQRISAVLLSLAGMLLALVGFSRVIGALLRIPEAIDFGAYYVAARGLNAGVPLYSEQVVPGAEHIHHTRYIYPPFMAAAMRPLALLDYTSASIIWLLLNVLAFVLTMLWLARLMRLSPLQTLGWCGLGLLFPAVYDTWLLGQLGMLLTLLFVAIFALTMQAERSRAADIMAGVLLGLAITLKVYPAVLGLVLLRYRRWSTLAATAGTTATAFGLGMLFGGGWTTTWRWFHDVLPSVATLSPFPSNQSLRGVLTRFFTYNTFQVPVLQKDNFLTVQLHPLINQPTLGALIVAAAVVGSVGLTAWVMWRPTSAHSYTIDFSLCVVLMLLITPVVWDLYYTHLLLPLAVLIASARQQPALRLWLIGTWFILMIQRYWRYMLLYVQTPWLMLFGIISVLIIFGLLIKQRVTLAKNGITSA